MVFRETDCGTMAMPRPRLIMSMRAWMSPTVKATRRGIFRFAKISSVTTRIAQLPSRSM